MKRLNKTMFEKIISSHVWYRYHKDGYVNEEILANVQRRQTIVGWTLIFATITVMTISFAVSCLFW